MPKPALQKNADTVAEADGMDAEPPRILLIEPQSTSNPDQTAVDSDGPLTPESKAVIKRSPEGQPISPVNKFNNLILKLAASTPPAKEAKEKLLLAVEKLISDGASLDCTDDSGRTPLHRACASGTRDMIALFLRHGPELKDARDKRGNTPLHVVCSERKGSALDLGLAVCFFVDAGVDVNCVNEDGVTALHLIAERGEDEWMGTVEFLLQKGAQVGLGDKTGKTALHKAAIAGCAELLEVLLQNGAAIDTVDELGHSALHMCVVSESVEAMEVLLRYGADVNLRDGRGHTVLHLVCRYGWIEAVDVLLENGAEVEIKDQDGLTALQLAKEAGAEAVMEVLRVRDGTARGRSRSPSVYYVRPADAEADSTGQTAESSDDDGDRVRNRVDNGVRDNHEDETENEVKEEYSRTENNGGDRVEDTADGTDDDQQDDTEEEQEDQAEEAPNTTNAEAILMTNEAMSNEETMQTSNDNTAEMTTTSNELALKELVSQDETRRTNNDTDQELPIQAHRNFWAGVLRDNGDGFTLARYDNHDISFDAKLETIRPSLHEGKDVHEVQIKLNFMRPYSMDHRIRYAKVDVNLSPSGSDAPSIRGIMPQADRMEVSEQEITSGKTFTVGASGNGGPSNVNISMEGSKSKRSTFKGVRIIHGAIRDRMYASWRLYEEPGSRSGLPEIVRLLLLIHCETEFDIRLALSVKACHFFTFGIPRTLTAPAGPSYTVPRLNIITACEHSARLTQMLDVADRAAAMIEETARLEESFSRAMREHKKRHLILSSGTEEAYLQQWSDILDDARTSDFTALRYKLLEMERKEARITREKAERQRQLQERRSERRVPEIEAYENDSDSASPRRWYRSRARYRASTSHYSESPKDRVWRGRAKTGDFRYYDDYTREHRREDRPGPLSGNPLENFTAVGPGYHVSRLA